MQLLTVRDAAARLGVGYSTFKQWIYQGVVRTTRTTGGHHRVSESEVARLVARTGPTPGRQNDRPGLRAVGALAGLSARNRLRGYIEEVRTDGLLAQVRMRIGTQTLTAIVTRDALEDLHLRRGDDAVAVIKSTEVMIGIEAPEERKKGRPPR